MMLSHGDDRSMPVPAVSMSVFSMPVVNKTHTTVWS